MTHGTSHIFYSNPDAELKNNSMFVKVVVKPTKIVISECALTEISPGTLSEVTLNRRWYEKETNSHGDVYVKCLTQETGSEHIRDTTLQSLSLREFQELIDGTAIESRFTVTVREPPKFKEFIRNTIIEWLGDEGISNFSIGMLFPSLKDFGASANSEEERVKMQADLTRTLREMENASEEDPFYFIRNALRENSGWEGFLKEACPAGVVSNEQDIKRLEEIPAYLRLAVCNLGMSIYEASHLGYDGVYNLFQTCFAHNIDYECIKFMLDYLPAYQRREATALILDIAARCNWETPAFRPGDSLLWDATLSVKRIPHSVRPVIAQELFMRLSNDVRPLLNSSNFNSLPTVTTGLYDTFQRGIAKHVLEPSLKSDLSLEAVENRFNEAFGVSFVEQEEDNIRQSKSGTFLVSPTGETSEDYYYYINDDGEYATLQSEPISFRATMEVVEQQIRRIDKKLVKLGRELTPANRIAYLRFDHRERDSQRAWYYYDLGVTEPSKIIALKMCKIDDATEVQMYAQLPDELFFELIGLISKHVVKVAKYLGDTSRQNTAANFCMDIWDGLI